MPTGDFKVELESLDRAVQLLGGLVVDEMNSLCRDWVNYLQGLDKGAWSTEDTCQDFAYAYVDTIEAFDQALQGVKKDVTRYRDNLDDIVSRYRSSDNYAQGEMNRLIGEFDNTGFAGDLIGQSAYNQRPRLDDQRSGPAPAPADTSPGE